jgi:hypothetical protein
LVAGDLNGLQDVFVHDALMSVTTRVSVVSHGGEGVGGASFDPTISSDGRYVVFIGIAANLAVGGNGFQQAYIHDRMTDITRRVSVSAGGAVGDGTVAGSSALSADGAFVAFGSSAQNLGPVTPAGMDAFVTDWRKLPPPPGVNVLLNGDFAAGLNRWGTFALPEPDDIVWSVTSGVLQFYRQIGSAQAVVLQGSGAQLVPFASLTASFTLGNSSAARKRISVLIHDSDFSDLAVCTFWLDASAPMRTYAMRMHTTRLWSDATISFYAATADGAGFYRVDNVTMSYDPAGSNAQTVCDDPTAPISVGSPGPNLLVNGDFGSGLAPWGTFGQIFWQIAAGVFEFVRTPGTPAGVVLQGTGQAMVNDQIISADFKLGNSSGQRKRVTVLLHDGDFSDLSACTFWLPPGLPLSTYTMRTFATKPWTNATIAVYAATIGTDPWFRLDDVAFRRASGSATSGTNCIEPDLSSLASEARSEGASVRGSQGRLLARSEGPKVRASEGPSGGARFAVQFWLPPHDGRVEIHVSADGETWVTVETLDASEEWTLVELEAGVVAHVRVRHQRPSLPHQLH